MKVQSSNISDVEYDAGSKTLTVTFKSGASYQYFDVPQRVYDTLVTSPSVGRAFQGLVKDAGYAFDRIE